MNYGELKSAVASDSHRTDPETIAEIPRFIRECEGLIRRELQAITVTATLDESDRDSGAVYNLPTGLQEIRAIYSTEENNEFALQPVSLQALKGLPSTASPYVYALRGDNQIEFRGTPGTDTEFDLEYFGHPVALSADGDTNSLLTNHETLYKAGALAFLYQYAIEPENAQGQFDIFYNVIDKLNAQFNRRNSGATVRGQYNLYGGQSSN